MNMAKLLATTALVALTATEAKESYVVKEDPAELAHDRPRVDMTVSEHCVVEQDELEVCFTFGAGLKIGWEWYQQTTGMTTDSLTGKYTGELRIFSEQEGAVDFRLLLDRLFKFQPAIELDDF
jgi:hypothetical protein